jgi:hypothetical protein
MSRRAAIMGWIAVALLVGYPLAKTPSRFIYGGRGRERMDRLSCLSLNDLFAVLNDSIQPGGVIASDPVTSYCIPALTDQFVVCTYDQHSIPNDSTALERILDCRDMLLPGADVAAAAATMQRYGASYIVINGRIPGAVTPMYWKPSARAANEAITRFSARKDLFRVRYRSRNLALLQRTGEGVPADAGDVAGERAGRKLPAADAARWKPSGEPGISIARVVVENGTVARGDTLTLEITWVTDRAVRPKSYITRVRFDTEFDTGPLYHPFYGKWYRKAVEKLRRMRYRFSVSRLPLSGDYPPDLWPVLHAVRDTFTVAIPSDTAPGIYTIAVQLSEQTHYPNYSVRDILSDEDLYSGVAVGTVTIE